MPAPFSTTGTDYLPKAVLEAGRVRQHLEAALPRRVDVQAMLVLLGAHGLTVRQQPFDVWVVSGAQLLRRLQQLPAILTYGEITAVSRAARLPLDVATHPGCAPPRSAPLKADGQPCESCLVTRADGLRAGRDAFAAHRWSEVCTYHLGRHAGAARSERGRHNLNLLTARPAGGATAGPQPSAAAQVTTPAVESLRACRSTTRRHRG